MDFFISPLISIQLSYCANEEMQFVKGTIFRFCDNKCCLTPVEKTWYVQIEQPKMHIIANVSEWIYELRPQTQVFQTGVNRMHEW